MNGRFEWIENNWTGWELRAVAPKDARPALLASGGGEPATMYALAGDLLVYGSNYSGVIHLLDLRTGDRRSLSGGMGAPGVATDGRVVVWAERPNSSAPDQSGGQRADLVGYDTVTGRRFAISTDTGYNAFPAIGGGLLAWVRGGERDRTIHALPLAALLASLPQPDPGPDTPDRRFFPETGHTLAHGFLTFWEAGGGLPVFGFPLTEEFPRRDAGTGRTYTVQYVERQRFEYHPELAGTPYEVSLGRLGAEDAARRNLGGIWAFAPIEAKADHPAGCRYLPEARHRLCGEFRPYWEANGLDLGDAGVSFRESPALFGYPISEEFIDPDTGLITQYFERAVFEYHPELPPGQRVLLGRLGAEVLTR